MLKIAITRTVKVKLPTLSGFSREFWTKVGDVVKGSILDNIAKQKTATGEQLKVNAPATRERKHRAGLPLLSLVDIEHRLVRTGDTSYEIVRYLAKGSGIVVGAATEEVAKLVRYVQKAGYVGWFGINRKGREAIKALVRQELARLVGAPVPGAAARVREGV